MIRIHKICYVVYRHLTILIAAAAIVLTTSPFVLAQQDAELSVDDAAKKLANPAGSLANLSNNITYRTFKGNLPDADDQTLLSYTFQPVLPFPVGDKGRNIIVRPAFTVSFDQPVFDSGQGQWGILDTEFNDITFDTVYSSTNMTGDKSGYLWGIGVAGTLPTAIHIKVGLTHSPKRRPY